MKKLLFILGAVLTFNCNAQTAYITNAGNNTVSVINVATNTVSATIPVGNQPEGISVSPDGTKVYVANESSSSNTVSVINTATNTVSATIPVGSNPIAFGNFISSYTTVLASLCIEPVSIAIYPNPTTNNITIEIPLQAVIEIYNMHMQLIKTIVADSNKTNIEVSNLTSGLYLIKVKTDKGVAVKKFVKE